MKDDASGLGKSSKTKNLDSHVQYVKGVGPGLSKTLQKVEIQTIEDLLFYFPKRYEDRSRFTQVAHLEHGRYACVCGRVVMSENQRTRRGMVLTRVGLDDGTGVVTLVFFNQAYLKERFVKLRDQLVIAYGEVRRLGWDVELQTPEWEEVVEEGDSLQIGRITPVYPLTDGLYQKTIRRAIRNALDTYLDQVDETLPKSLLERLKLPGIQDAIRGTHYPENADVLKVSRYRLIFEDFFLLQMALALR
jgi:ATP-dependent DNA helicase RecG